MTKNLNNILLVAAMLLSFSTTHAAVDTQKQTKKSIKQENMMSQTKSTETEVDNTDTEKEDENDEVTVTQKEG